MSFDATFFAFVALVIFLGIAAYAGAFRAMGSGLDNRAARIAKELDEASRLRREAEALVAEYKQKRIDAESQARDIVAQAKTDAQEYAGEARKKFAEQLYRLTRHAEEQIAQAEAAAVKDVRNTAADLAVAAAQRMLAGSGAAQKAELIASSISAVKNRLN